MSKSSGNQKNKTCAGARPYFPSWHSSRTKAGPEEMRAAPAAHHSPPALPHTPARTRMQRLPSFTRLILSQDRLTLICSISICFVISVDCNQSQGLIGASPPQADGKRWKSSCSIRQWQQANAAASLPCFLMQALQHKGWSTATQAKPPSPSACYPSKWVWRGRWEPNAPSKISYRSTAVSAPRNRSG